MAVPHRRLAYGAISVAVGIFVDHITAAELVSGHALRQMALVAIQAGVLVEVDMGCVAEEATAHATFTVKLRAVVIRA